MRSSSNATREMRSNVAGREECARTLDTSPSPSLSSALIMSSKVSLDIAMVAGRCEERLAQPLLEWRFL